MEEDSVQLPSLPAVVVKARELLSSENLNARALSNLLEQDAAIVAALMRLANSAAFGGLGRVDNLKTAIQRIGHCQLAPIITGLGLKGAFRHPQPEKARILEVLWNHSVTTAFAARAIASRVRIDPERAFLAGLLHDCGKVLVLSVLDALEAKGEAVGVTDETRRELMSALHCRLGHRVLVSWNLPDDVASVALRHHEKAGPGDGLLLVVQAANLITRRLGFHPEPDPNLRVVTDPSIEELGMTDMQVATLMIDMEDHLAEMQRLF
ncbi:MAG: HDOD domain-containing protein [Gemmatimonadaceae bacterium]